MQVFFKAGDGYSDVYGVAWPLREDTKQVSPHVVLRHGSASCPSFFSAHDAWKRLCVSIM